MKKVLKTLLIGGLFASLIAGMAHPSLGAKKKSKSHKSSWSAPVLINSDQAHRETSIALSPKDPDLMLACAPSGVPNTQENQSYFHVTRDGGKTWNPLRIEGEQSNDTRNFFFEGGDCDVEFDEGGTAYTADTWLGSLSIGHSTDGARSWTGTPLAASSPIVDRPWLVGGPKGTVHVSYQDLQCCMPSAIWYTKSTDFGATFSPAVPVASAGPEGGFTWEGNLVVAKNQQDLYLPYSRRAGAAVGSLDDSGPETLWVAASHDGGTMWNSTLIAAMPNPVSYLYPSMAIDKKGNLHVVFASLRGAGVDRPIWYAFSKNKGETWTKPRPLTTGAAGFSPWVDVDDSGEVTVVWYGSPDPKAKEGVKAEWYFYWARIRGAGTSSMKITSGRTTNKPIFSGISGIPEFENVMLDSNGRMHIGMSAYFIGPDKRPKWALYYQREN